MRGIGGWLLVYLVASAPVTLFYAGGLAGRFFNYHWGAIAAFFLILAVPLALLVLGVPSAPAWNIASLWVGAGSLVLILFVASLSAEAARIAEIAGTMVTIGVASIVWATVWTVYFLRSERVATTFI